MLVLTRKPHQTIRIGNDITVSIVKVKGNSVRIGIEAPGRTRIIRGELATRVADSPEAIRDEAVANDAAGTAKDGPADTVAQFEPPAKISTQNVNRILASRRNGRPSGIAPLAEAFKTVAGSASWNKPGHLPVT